MVTCRLVLDLSVIFEIRFGVDLSCFTEDTLYTGSPGDYEDPGSLLALPEVRKLIDNGQYADADVAAEKMLGGSSEVIS